LSALTLFDHTPLVVPVSSHLGDGLGNILPRHHSEGLSRPAPDHCKYRIVPAFANS